MTGAESNAHDHSGAESSDKKFLRWYVVHVSALTQDALNSTKHQQLADRSRACTLEEDDLVKEAWLMKLEYYTHSDRSNGKMSSQATNKSDRSSEARITQPPLPSLHAVAQHLIAPHSS